MGGQPRTGLELQDLVDDADYADSQSINSSLAFGIASSQDGQQGSKTRREGTGPATNLAVEELEVVFIKDNVSVHPTQSASQRINGRIRLLKQGPSLFMTWIPYTQRGAVKEGASGSVGNGTNNKPMGMTSERDRNLYTIRAMSLAEVRSIRRHTPPLGWQYIIIVLTSGLAFPPLYFHNGGIKEFLGTLKEHVHIVRSSHDANLFLVNDISQDPLQRSLTSLELRDVVPVSTAAPSNNKEQLTSEAPSNKNQGLTAPTPSEQSVALIQSQETRIFEEDNREKSNNLETSEHRQHRRSRDPARDLSIHVLEKFSLVTKFARETTAQLFGESRLLTNSDGPEELDRMYGSRKQGEEKRDLGEELKPLLVQQADNSQELANTNPLGISDECLQQYGEKRKPDGEASTNVGIFELVDGTQNDTETLGGHLPPLGSEEWPTFLDGEGRVADSKALRKRIFYGGIERGLRREVWKFLLGHYQFDSTYKEREDLVVRKYGEYKVLKAQWETVSDDQAKRFTKFRERKSRIEKDVVRTDRSLPFYAGDDNPNVTILRDILITYSFYNFDLGYCQGMSDLLSPILFVMEDESESFWCFASLMEHLAPNFHRDQNGMHSQLLALSKLVQLLDSPLHNYLKQADCLNYFFCFRWILIQFKREFEYEDVIRLWEVFWTNHLSEHLHLYMCVALLKRYRKKIIEEQMDFDTLLKFINELSGHIDLERTLRDAEALFLIAGDLGSACIPPGTPPALQVSGNDEL